SSLEWPAAHHCGCRAQGILRNIRRILMAILDTNLNAGTVRARRIQNGKSGRALDRGICTSQARRDRRASSGADLGGDAAARKRVSRYRQRSRSEHIAIMEIAL